MIWEQEAFAIWAVGVLLVIVIGMGITAWNARKAHKP